MSVPRVFLSIISMCTLMFVHAQGPWTQRASMPGTARHRAYTFTIGQRGYFGGGWNGVTMYGDFWEYDPGSNCWAQKSNYPGGPRLSAFGFSIGNKGYAGTGLDQNLYAQSDFYEYNPVTNQWTMKAYFTGTPVFAATACVANGKGFVFFGDDWDLNYWKHNEVYSYNPSTNAWAYVTAFPGDGRRDQVGFTINNMIYIGTGNDNSYTELGDWWMFNPNTSTWTAKAPFIGSVRSQAVGFAINGKGYLGTGGQLDERDFFEYDPATNSWQGINEFPGAGRENSMSFVIGTRAYIIAGTSGINYKDCWEFNPNEVTGIEEQQDAATSCWPNPATDFLNINLQLSGDFTYQIYSISGQLVTENRSSVSGGVLQIPVNQLENGQYEVIVSDADHRWITRFTR